MKLNHELDWVVNKKCNLDCIYCFPGAHSHCEDKNVGKWSIHNLVRAINHTGIRWYIRLSGGEPFLYPDFIKLVHELKEAGHILAIVTNLSTTDLIKEFIESISCHNIERISASLHIMELEKKDLIQNFIESFRELQEKDFYVIVNYICHPLVIPRIEKDIRYFSNLGIELSLKFFRGKYLGKTYPDSYTTFERNQIERYLKTSSEQRHFTNGLPNFMEKVCKAGYNFLSMSPNLNLYRCTTHRVIGGIPLGNLMKGFNFLCKGSCCPYEKCLCPTEGLKYSIV